MENRKGITDALRGIGKYGRSEMAIDIYIESIASILKEDRTNHTMAVAETMSRLAPESKKDAWYTTGLLHELLTHENKVNITPDDILELMGDAGINPAVINCLMGYRKIRNPRDWDEQMAALYFADIHTDDEGNIMTTAECCSKNKGGPQCNECMYARYILKEKGFKRKAVNLISTLNETLDIRKEKLRSMRRKEIRNGISDKRRMEEIGS